MEFTLSNEQQTLRESIVAFSQANLNEGVSERDAENTFPLKLWQQCGEIGIQGLPVPPALGGQGLDALSTAVALEALGYGCEDSGLVFSLCAHLLACVVPIWLLGTEDQKRKYLPGLCDGSTVGAFAMTEPDSGSDAFALKTIAVKDGEHYRLSGRKTLISNAPVASVTIVGAVTDPEKGYHGGLTAFLVESSCTGYRASHTQNTMGLRTASTGEVSLNDVTVSSDAILGGVGAGAAAFTAAMNWERICLFASHVGTMERLMERSIAFARRHNRFGQAIGKFQAVSHRIADMKVRLEAARLLTYQSAWRLGRVRDASMDASLTKLFVSESLVDTALSALHIQGGKGYLADSAVERAVRDALGSTVYSGTSEMQRNIIARWLGLW